MVYFIKNGEFFSSIQPYEVRDAFNSGKTVYRDDFETIVTDPDEEDLTPREMSGTITGAEVTYVNL